MKTPWLAVALALATSAAAQSPLSYPAARKAEVTEELFGVQVSDPYRWMEEAGSKEVEQWVAAQNALTFGYLEGLPLRRHFQKRITELWDYPQTSVPVATENGRLFYRRNSGLQLQAPIYMRTGMKGAATLLLDPNAFRPTARWRWPISGPRRMRARSPTPWRKAAPTGDTLRVRDVASGRDLADELRWVRFSWISWTATARASSIRATRSRRQGRRSPPSSPARRSITTASARRRQTMCWSTRAPTCPKWFVGAWVTEDGRYLVVRMARGAGPVNRLYYADLGNARRPNVRAAVKPLVEEDGKEYWPLGNDGPLLYVRSDDGASNRRIIGIDMREPRRAAWKTLVPEAKDAIELRRLHRRPHRRRVPHGRAEPRRPLRRGRAAARRDRAPRGGLDRRPGRPAGLRQDLLRIHLAAVPQHRLRL